MSFREKSAWAMALVVAVAGAFYGWIVVQAPQAPVIGPFLPFFISVFVLALIVQLILVFTSLREAAAPADERELRAIDRAGHWSGIALGGVVLMGALAYIVTGSGNMLFHAIIGGLIVAQLLEYGFQIALFRRGH